MNDLEKCKKYLRSILLANKGGVPGAQVMARYKDIVGESVPYRKFNFSNLENFLRSIPDVCRITVRGRDVMVVGVETPETKHIKDLIQRQGKGGGKHGGGRPAPVNRNQFYIDYINDIRARGKNNNLTSTMASPNHTSSSKQLKQSPPQRPQPIVAPVKITPRKVTASAHAQKVTAQPAVKQPGSYQATVKQPAVMQAAVKQPGSTPQVLPVTKESVRVWSGRVRKLLEGHPHGLSLTQVERFHEKHYQERLPASWDYTMLNHFSDIGTKHDPTKNIMMFLVAKKTVNNNNPMVLRKSL